MWQFLKNLWYDLLTSYDEQEVEVRVRDADPNGLYITVEIEDEVVKVPASYEDVEYFMPEDGSYRLVKVRYYKVNGAIVAELAA
jgi:hypothetical protein